MSSLLILLVNIMIKSNLGSDPLINGKRLLPYDGSSVYLSQNFICNYLGWFGMQSTKCCIILQSQKKGDVCKMDVEFDDSRCYLIDFGSPFKIEAGDKLIIQSQSNPTAQRHYVL